MSTQMEGLDLKMIARRLRIEAFMADYILALDSDRLEEWPSFFAESAVYRITTRENYEQGLPLSVMSCAGRGMLVDRISALRTANVFEPHVYCHVPGALRILAADEATVESESTLLVVRTMADGTMSLYACGRSLDHFLETADGLKITKRVVILDSRQIDTLLVIPL